MNHSLYKQLLDASVIAAYCEKSKQEIEKRKKEIAANLLLKEELEQQIHEKPRGYSAKKGWGIFLIIFGAVCIIPMLVFTILLLCGVDPGPSMIECIAGIFIYFIAVVFPGILLCIFARMSRKKHIREYTEAYNGICKDEIEPNVEKAELEIKTIASEANEIWLNNKHILDFLPEKYHNILAIGFMLSTVENLRANTLTEAINLYENEIHHWELKNILNNTEKIQQKNNMYMQLILSETQRNQEILMDSMRDIKIMQLLDLTIK